jgi:hypothetical protein
MAREVAAATLSLGDQSNVRFPICRITGVTIPVTIHLTPTMAHAAA